MSGDYERSLPERVAVLEANHVTLFKRLDGVVEQLQKIADMLAKTQGAARALQWIAGLLVFLAGWGLDHLPKLIG